MGSSEIYDRSRGRLRNGRSVSVRTVRHRSPEWEKTVDLRDRVLRAPLGLQFDVTALASEADSWHLAAFDDDGDLLGCLVLTPQSEQEVRMRQVAVEPDLQRSGVGSLLVRESEVLAREEGYSTMILHARDVAIPFYLALGYRVTGEPFEEVSIPHRIMVKTL